jgi:hypothetical protein
VDGFEALGADEDGVGFGEAMGLSFLIKEFVDRRFPALIPGFFKPALYEGLVLL